MKMPIARACRILLVLAAAAAVAAPADTPQSGAQGTAKPAQLQKPPETQAPARTVPAIKPIPPDVLKAMRTGVARYEVSGVDFHVQGGGPLSGYEANTQQLMGDSPDDSVIVVRGTVHGAGIADQETGEVPARRFEVSFKGWDIFPGLPASCRIAVVPYPQATKWGRSYVVYIAFKDTSKSQECWQYFRSLKTMTLQLQAIKTNMHPNIPPLPLTDGGSRTLTLGPLLPKSPQP